MEARTRSRLIFIRPGLPCRAAPIRGRTITSTGARSIRRISLWYIDGVQTNQIATPTAYMSGPFFIIMTMHSGRLASDWNGEQFLIGYRLGARVCAARSVRETLSLFLENHQGNEAIETYNI